MGSDSYYWPLGVTAVYYAAGTGDEELLTYLLSQGADVDERTKDGRTPLQHAAMMGKMALARLLLSHGANVNAQNKLGQTALQVAVLRNNREMVRLLLDADADPNLADKRGYAAADWAALQGHSHLLDLLLASGANEPRVETTTPVEQAPHLKPRLAPEGESVVGRVLDGKGQPIDGGPNVARTQPVIRTVANKPALLFETGIKIIDLFAPLKRGGHVAIFSPLSGAGRLVMMGQLMQAMMVRHDGYVVHLGIERGEETAESWLQACRGEYGFAEWMLRERMVHLFSQADDTAAQKQQLAETALTLAQDFWRQGHDVLLVLHDPIASVEGVVEYLRANTVVSPGAAITVLYDGDYTAGLEPEPYTDLDAVITFTYERARQGLWPAVDPLASWSRMLRPERVGSHHAQTVAEARQLLKRYQGLHDQVEHGGMEGLFYFNDREAEETVVLRARRLHRFLTQPHPGLELWTGRPGRYVDLGEALAGCRDILAGKYDDVNEDAFYMVGAIDDVSAS